MANDVPGFGMPGVGYWPTSGGGGGGGGGGKGSDGPTIDLTPPDDRYYAGFTSAKDGKTYGPRLIETRVAFSLYGVPIPRSFGTRRLPANIIAADNLHERRVVKGNVITFEYYATFAISFGYPNPDLAITERDVIRIWADGRLQVDNRSNSRQAASGFYYRFYKGTETQEADPILESIFGVGMVPGFRGQMYMVVVDLPLKDYNNKIPEITTEIGDSAAIDSIVTTIDGTDDANQNFDHVFVNWNTMKLWVQTGNSATTSAVNAYDIVNGTFLHSVPVNQSGQIDKGMFNFGGYIPWLNLAIQEPWLADSTPVIYLFNPDVGIAKSGVVGEQPRQLVPGRVNTTIGDYTYIMNITGFDNIELLQIDPTGEMTNTGVHYTAHTSDTVLNGTPGTATDKYCMFYFCDDSSDSVHSLKVTPGLLGLGDTVNGAVFTEDAIVYDGVASTYVRNLHYSSQENCLFIFYNNGEARKYDLTDLANAWRITDLPNAPGSRNLWMTDLTNGLIPFLHTNGDIIELNTLLGSWDTFDSSNVVIDHGTEVCDSRTRTCVGLGLVSHKASIVRYSALSDVRMLVTDVVRALANEVGYPDANLDIDPLIDDEIDGAIIEQYQTFAEFLEPVKTIYGYEIVESGDKLRITNKAKLFTSADFTITAEELVIRQRGADAFRIRREEEGFHPHMVSVTYINKQITYHWDTQVAARNRTAEFETNESGTSTSFKLPFIMTALEAKYAAYRVLWNPWVGRATQSFSLPTKYLTVEPGDTVSITVKGFDHLIKAIETTVNTDFTVDILGQTFQTFEDFPLDAFAGTEYEPVLPTVAIGARIVPFEVPPIWDEDDISVLSDTDTKGFIYYVIIPDNLTDDFDPGAQGFMAIGSGPYKPLRSSTVAVPNGVVAANVMRPANPFAFDDEGIQIRLSGGDSALLTSVSDEDFLNGANLALIGRHDHWELISYRDVTENADGSFTLNHMMRGLKGTDWVLTTYGYQRDGAGSYSPSIPDANVGGKKRGGHPAATITGGIQEGDTNSTIDMTATEGPNTVEVIHPIGDLFVMLHRDWVFPAYTAIDNVGKAHRFKVVTPGQDLAAARALTVYYYANSMAPYPVQEIHATRDDDGLLTISWKRRHRLTSELHDGDGDVPITELENNRFLVILYNLGGVQLSIATPENHYSTPEAHYARDGVSQQQPGIFKLVNGLSASWTYLQLYDAMINAFDDTGSGGSIIDDLGTPEATGIAENLTNVATTFYRNYMSFNRVLVCVRQISNLQTKAGLPDASTDIIGNATGIPYSTTDITDSVIQDPVVLMTDAEKSKIISDRFELRFGPYNVKFVDVEDI